MDYSYANTVGADLTRYTVTLLRGDWDYGLGIDDLSETVYSMVAATGNLYRPIRRTTSVEHVSCINRSIGFIEIGNRIHFVDHQSHTYRILTGENGVILGAMPNQRQ